MTSTTVVDQFLSQFTSILNSGFGLLQPEVNYLSATFIVIDLTIAAVFWAWGNDGPDGVLRNLIRKVLYIGAFSFIIQNYQTLANVIFDSFSQIGVTASGATMSAAKLMQPGDVALLGFTAGDAILRNPLIFG